MKLIKDYLPHLTYQNERLQREANALDRSEFKKLLIPGFELDEQICRERCNYLMGYILKHEFQVTVGTGSVISLHDASADPPKTYVNTVPKTVEQIFKALKNVSIHNNWRFALYDILENIVRPELSKERPFTRYPETHQWLQSLYNEEFWGQDRPASFTEISCLLQHLCDERKNKGSNSSVRRNYITELLSLFSALQKEPESKEGRRKLLTLCSRIKLFLGHALSRDRLEDGSKALKVIHDVAIENLLMKLSSRQTSVNYFFSTEQRAYVDEITLVQLKSQVSQDIAIGDALTIEQALLRVFAKVQEMNNSQIRFNLTLAEQWLSDLGINKDEPCISEIDEVQPQTVLVGAY